MLSDRDGMSAAEQTGQSSTPRWWCSAGTWSHADPPPGFDVYVLKTATLEPRINPCPLVLRELPDGGYLNRIGVRNPGLSAVLDDLPDLPGERVVSVLGFTRDEWWVLGTMAESAAVPVLEARKSYSGRLGAKLPPTASVDVALACVEEGANYLCLSNTLGTPMGGMSGRPLRAMALECIARIAPHVSIPIVGGGGILHRANGPAYLDRGATDLFMGTAHILNGYAPEAVREP